MAEIGEKGVYSGGKGRSGREEEREKTYTEPTM